MSTQRMLNVIIFCVLAIGVFSSLQRTASAANNNLSLNQPPTVATAPPTAPTVATAPPTAPTVATAPPTAPTVATAPPTAPTAATAPPTAPTVATAPPTAPTVATGSPTPEPGSTPDPVSTAPPTAPPTVPTVPASPTQEGVGTPLAQIQFSIVADTGTINMSGNRIVVYTMTYENIGLVTAEGVQIVAIVPLGTTFISDQSSPGWNCTDVTPNSVCTFDVGDVPVGAQGSLLFVVEVENGAIGDMEATGELQAWITALNLEYLYATGTAISIEAARLYLPFIAEP